MTSASTEAAPEATASAAFVGVVDGRTSARFSFGFSNWSVVVFGSEAVFDAACCARRREPAMEYRGDADSAAFRDASAPPTATGASAGDAVAGTAEIMEASRPASRRAASNSKRMRGEIAPVIPAKAVLIVSAICVNAAKPKVLACR